MNQRLYDMIKRKITHIPEFRMVESELKGIMFKKLNSDFKVSGDHSIVLPHRDDHYMLVIINDGKIGGNIDFEDFELNSPYLLLVCPGQVHLLTPQTPLSGWVIDFSAAVVDPQLKNELSFDLQGPLLMHHPKFNVAFEQIKKLLAVMETLFEQRLVMKKAISAVLLSILHIIHGMASYAAGDGKQKNNRPQLIKRQFLALLYEHYSHWKKPSQYAEKLAISTAHLNDTMKKVVGRTATAIIQEHCMHEAQRLLHYTDLSVKEICYQLGYPNPSHFIAIFNARVGTTPLQYRVHHNSTSL
jgi:AraC family transcriptional activator of pobA